MSNLVFKPIIPIFYISIFTFIMLVIVLINRKHIINRLLIIALVFIISQRPILINQEDATYSLNLDVVFVVDTTLSMLAVDVNAYTRLDLVKDLMKKIVNDLPGSRFAIISQDNSAFVKYPLTFDNAAILSVIDNLKVIEGQYSAGSSISVSADYLRMLLNSSNNTAKKDLANRKKIVFYFGDGELDNADALRKAMEAKYKSIIESRTGKKFEETEEDNEEELVRYNGMNELIDNGAVMGVGTAEGGNIRAIGYLNDPQYAEKGFLIDYYTQKLAVTKLDEAMLKKLSSKLGIDYFNAESGKLNAKLDEIKGLVEKDETGEKVRQEKDLYYYFSTGLLLLLIYELYYYRRNEL